MKKEKLKRVCHERIVITENVETYCMLPKGHKGPHEKVQEQTLPARRYAKPQQMLPLPAFKRPLDEKKTS
jgi:hypothetical protein